MNHDNSIKILKNWWTGARNRFANLGIFEERPFIFLISAEIWRNRNFTFQGRMIFLEISSDLLPNLLSFSGLSEPAI